MSRNTAVDMAKGIAIILVVVAHAELPGVLNRAIYLFHMPLFFITAGYFFSPSKATADPWAFICKRFKGLYVPFVTWSIFFLLIHNLLFKVGILNEVYGNWSGGVTHPYTWADFHQRLVSIVFSMGGYDEFLAGAFWFFRGLLVASVAFMVGWWLLGKNARLRERPVVIAIVLIAAALLLAAYKVGCGWRINTLTQGGYRDLMGTAFFGFGFLYRRYEDKIGHSLWMALIGAVVVVGCAFAGCNGMSLSPRLVDVATLPLTGIAGWLMTYNVCHKAAGKLRPVATHWLARVGELSLYVFIWHVSAYKVVSWLKIQWYDLDPRQIGCHMVIHDYASTDLFWLLYTIAGVGIPIAGWYAWQSLKSKTSFLRFPAAEKS